MPSYRMGVIREGSKVSFSNDQQNTVATDRGKTHHVLYPSYDERVPKARALLGQSFECKLLEGDAVIFLTQTEADTLVRNAVAIEDSSRTTGQKRRKNQS